MTHNNESTIPRAYKGVYLDELEMILTYTGELKRALTGVDQRMSFERILRNPKFEDSELIKFKLEIQEDRMPKILLQILAELTIRYRDSVSNMDQIKVQWRNNSYYYGFTDDDVEKLADKWSRNHESDPHSTKGKVISVNDHDLHLASESFKPSKRAVSGKYIIVESYKHFDTLTCFKLDTGETVYFATAGGAPFGSVKARLAVAADQRTRDLTGVSESVPANGPASRDAAKMLRDHKGDLD